MRTILLLLLIFVSAANAQTSITKIEYWIDSDPGFDNATTVSGFPVTNDLSTQITIPSNIPPGIHYIGIRSKDASGLWSHTNIHTILVDDTATFPLTDIEYFVDNDPGFGNATPYNGFVSQYDVMTQLSASLSPTLSAGNHFLGIRSRLTNNRWGHTNIIPFYVADTSSGLITKVEYFWDVDPGFENGIDSVLAVPVSDIANGLFLDSVPLSFLLGSTHILYERSMDNRGRWSHTNYVNSLIVNGTVDINELADLTGIRIYPNPVIDEMTVDSEKAVQSRFILYDGNGRKVIDQFINGKTKINTQLLAKGVYTVFILTDVNEMYRSTVVKQ